MTNILIIEGSPSKASFTRVLAKTFAQKASTLGAAVEFWSLLEKPLPFAMPEYHWDFESTPDPNAIELGNQIKKCDGIALASPLYHGSFSGVLKNALDNFWYDAFRDKPVALMSHGSTNKRCAQPCEHLMTIVKTMYGYPIQTQVATCKSEYKIEENRPINVVSEDILERLARQATELVQMAKLLKGQQLQKDSD